MILKMAAVTAFYVLATVFLWKRTRDKELSMGARIGIGVFYGVCSILSTHFAVDYGHMLLNVRDIGPLAGGLFFHPLSGIIAGLIGGIERYIAGTYWNIGSYTRIACSVSTCLAGFIAMFMRIFIFRNKRPEPIAAFFMAAVMEIFHMYAIFITHRNDMTMAHYVVRNCAGPMIIFTALGMAVSSAVIMKLNGEWRNPFRRQQKKDIRLSRHFQNWLFLAFTIVFTLNFISSIMIQKHTSDQYARATLIEDSDDIRQSYLKVREARKEIIATAEKSALSAAGSIADAVGLAGGFDALSPDFSEELLTLYKAEAVSIFSADGSSSLTAGDESLCVNLFQDITAWDTEGEIRRLENGLTAAAVKDSDGMFQTVINAEKFTSALNLSSLNESISSLRIGREGSFDIIDRNGVIISGKHKGSPFSAEELELLRKQPDNSIYNGSVFGTDSMCRKVSLGEGEFMRASLSVSEIYAEMESSILETVFEDLLLVSGIYVLIMLLVERTVVDDITLVNRSLNNITAGDLSETVNVRNSAEFNTLSNDINQTVDVLKGYIDAAEKKMEEELILARTIQESALPHNFTFPRSDFELYALMDPAKEVGGDFYDFFFIDTNKLVLVIADVSGKGIPASLFMMRSKTAIRSFADKGVSPDEILFQVNNTLCEGNDAEMFVTVWIGIIDLTTGIMKCANAGHEYPVLMRAGGDYELVKDKHTLALAAMPGIRAKEYELQLHPGDKIFVYTDGVPEAINETVQDYGTERLVSKLNQMKDATPEVTVLAAKQDLSAFTGSADQFDDITMLSFHYKSRNDESGTSGNEE